MNCIAVNSQCDKIDPINDRFKMIITTPKIKKDTDFVCFELQQLMKYIEIECCKQKHQNYTFIFD